MSGIQADGLIIYDRFNIVGITYIYIYTREYTKNNNYTSAAAAAKINEKSFGINQNQFGLYSNVTVDMQSVYGTKLLLFLNAALLFFSSRVLYYSYDNKLCA